MALNIKISEKQPDIMSPRILVAGVGGGGNNAVSNLIRESIEGVDFVALNTDAQSLTQCLAEKKLQLGPKCTLGLGAGAKPDIGRLAADESEGEIRAALTGYNMVFIAAGMGGGTGTGASPVVSAIAREMGILTVGVVTKPFDFEGKRKMDIAENGINELSQVIDTLIVISNQNLFLMSNDQTTLPEAFRLADNVLCAGVRAVTDLIIRPGLKNLDFNDVRSVMQDQGLAVIGTAEASGADRANKAASSAANNPLLDNIEIKDARNILINVTGGLDLTALEVDEILNNMRDLVHKDAEIHWGATIDESLDDAIRVSLVVTGIGSIYDKIDDEWNAEVARGVAIANHAAGSSAPSSSPALSAAPAAPASTVAQFTSKEIQHEASTHEEMAHEIAAYGKVANGNDLANNLSSDSTRTDPAKAEHKDLPNQDLPRQDLPRQDLPSRDLQGATLSEDETRKIEEALKGGIAEQDGTLPPKQPDFFDQAVDKVSRHEARDVRETSVPPAALVADLDNSFVSQSPHSFTGAYDNHSPKLTGVKPLVASGAISTSNTSSSAENDAKEGETSGGLFQKITEKLHLNQSQNQPQEKSEAEIIDMVASDDMAVKDDAKDDAAAIKGDFVIENEDLFPDQGDRHTIPAFLRRKA